MTNADGEPDPQMLAGLQQALVLHGLDFAITGVRQLNDGETRADRYAVVHLALGIELLLKARLLAKDWRAVFASKKKANAASLRTGDLHSVSAEDCVERLKEAGVEIDEQKEQWLEELRDARNDLVHFPAAINVDALKVRALRSLGFVLDFSATVIGDSMDEIEAADELRKQLLELEAFREQRWHEIRHELPASRLVECPVCYEEAGYGDDGYRCVFCGIRMKAEDAADRYLEDVIELSYDPYNGDEWPRRECDICVKDAMIPLADGTSYCFSCGNTVSDDDDGEFDDERPS